MPELCLDLPYPPTVNHYYRNWRGRTVISDKGRAYRLEVAVSVGNQDLRFGTFPIESMALEGKLYMREAVYLPDRRRRDLDNIQKPLWDALQHAGVFKDDSQIREFHVKDAGIVRGGHVKVWISDWEGREDEDVHSESGRAVL